MEITGLFIYPIKSMGGISLKSSTVEMRGLKYDRRWMLVDENNRFLSQREQPFLSRFSLVLNDEFFTVTNNLNNEQVNIPLEKVSGQNKKVHVWEDEVLATVVQSEISMWFSNQIGQMVDLVYQPNESIRPVDSNHTITGEEHNSLSDGYPVLLISEASLEFINSHCPERIPMERFRPNIVVKNIEAFEEGKLEKLSFNDVVLYGVKPCARCNVPNLNPETLTFSKEPSLTLSKIRKFGNKILFGQNLVVHKIGRINVGDKKSDFDLS
jgi:uncharacterized protein YcbX